MHIIILKLFYVYAYLILAIITMHCISLQLLPQFLRVFKRCITDIHEWVEVKN